MGRVFINTLGSHLNDSPETHSTCTLYNYIDMSVSLENTPLSHKINMKLHQGPEWHIFHILTKEDTDDAISCLFMIVCANSQCTENYLLALRFYF